MCLLKENLICNLFLFSSFLIHQPCCRGDGDSRLEVHGGVSSAPGGWSVSLPGFCSVPFPRTPTQTPQTVLTVPQEGIHTHSYKLTPLHIHALTKTHRSPPNPQTHRDNISPLLLPTTLPTASPQISPFCPIQNLLYLVSSKDGGKEEEEMDEREKWDC